MIRMRNPRRSAGACLTDTLAQAKYGDRIKVVTGPRGTGFFEEQTIIHKQALPQEPRVALLITHSLRRRGARG
jgi:hypothetical protein